MARHMRDKTMHCDSCHDKRPELHCSAHNCVITADLDRGTVVHARMPAFCKSPAWCLEEFKKGIFDRQFGARLVTPLKH